MTPKPSFDVEAAARKLVERTCAAQGLPVDVEDDAALETVARIVLAAKRSAVRG